MFNKLKTYVKNSVQMAKYGTGQLNYEAMFRSNNDRYVDYLIQNNINDMHVPLHRELVAMKDPLARMFTWDFQIHGWSKYPKFYETDQIDAPEIMEDVRALLMDLDYKKPAVIQGVYKQIHGWNTTVYQGYNGELAYESFSEYQCPPEQFVREGKFVKGWNALLYPHLPYDRTPLGNMGITPIPNDPSKLNIVYTCRLDKYASWGYGFSILESIWDAVTKLRMESDADSFRKAIFPMAITPPDWDEPTVDKFYEKISKMSRTTSLTYSAAKDRDGKLYDSIPSVTFMSPSDNVKQTGSGQFGGLSSEWTRVLAGTKHTMGYIVGGGAISSSLAASGTDLTDDLKTDIDEWNLCHQDHLKKFIMWLADSGLIEQPPASFTIKSWWQWEHDETMVAQAEMAAQEMQMQQQETEEKPNKENASPYQTYDLDIWMPGLKSRSHYEQYLFGLLRGLNVENVQILDMFPHDGDTRIGVLIEARESESRILGALKKDRNLQLNRSYDYDEPVENAVKGYMGLNPGKTGITSETHEAWERTKGKSVGELGAGNSNIDRKKKFEWEREYQKWLKKGVPETQARKKADSYVKAYFNSAKVDPRYPTSEMGLLGKAADLIKGKWKAGRYGTPEEVPGAWSPVNSKSGNVLSVAYTQKTGPGGEDQVFVQFKDSPKPYMYTGDKGENMQDIATQIQKEGGEAIWRELRGRPTTGYKKGKTPTGTSLGGKPNVPLAGSAHKVTYDYAGGQAPHKTAQKKSLPSAIASTVKSIMSRNGVLEEGVAETRHPILQRFNSISEAAREGYEWNGELHKGKSTLYKILRTSQYENRRNSMHFGNSFSTQNKFKYADSQSPTGYVVEYQCPESVAKLVGNAVPIWIEHAGERTAEDYVGTYTINDFDSETGKESATYDIDWELVDQWFDKRGRENWIKPIRNLGLMPDTSTEYFCNVKYDTSKNVFIQTDFDLIGLALVPRGNCSGPICGLG